MYRLLFKLLLKRLDPERAHTVAARWLSLVHATKLGQALLARLAGSPDACLEVCALGTVFKSPLGAAAGIDKDATWFEELLALGFGFVEVGTLTALGQPGNDRPRIARLHHARALLNRMGFPNRGARRAAGRLGRRATKAPVGVNIGKSKVVALDAAVADYRASVRCLAPVADYIALNVSSPNTPGLRLMQAAEVLRELVTGVRAELSALGVSVPLLVKIAPDLSEQEIDDVCALAVKLKLDGLIAVNTTIQRACAPAGTEFPFADGGLSGAPLKQRALEVLRRVRSNVGGQMTIISVGGVQSAQDVWERLAAGATLVQAYTAFVYGGPRWPSQVNRELARMVKAAGLASIEQLIGADEREAQAA